MITARFVFYIALGVIVVISIGIIPYLFMLRKNAKTMSQEIDELWNICLLDIKEGRHRAVEDEDRVLSSDSGIDESLLAESAQDIIAHISPEERHR